MPSLRNLAQLRELLPYATRLLPLLTGQPAAAALPAELATVHRHLGEMQTESRDLRAEVASHGERLAQLPGDLTKQLAAQLTPQLTRQLATVLSTQLAGQVNSRLDRLTALAERAAEEQAAATATLGRLASLVKLASVAALLLLVAICVMCGLLLTRVP